MAKWPLQPGDIDRLEYEALRREFHVVCAARGYNWTPNFIFPEWAMREVIRIHGNRSSTERVQSPCR